MCLVLCFRYLFIVCCCQSPTEVYSFPRETASAGIIEKTKNYYRGLSKAVPPKPACAVLSTANQVVRIVPMKTVADSAFQEGKKEVFVEKKIISFSNFLNDF